MIVVRWQTCGHHVLICKRFFYIFFIMINFAILLKKKKKNGGYLCFETSAADREFQFSVGELHPPLPLWTLIPWFLIIRTHSLHETLGVSAPRERTPFEHTRSHLMRHPFSGCGKLRIILGSAGTQLARFRHCLLRITDVHRYLWAN